MNPGDNRGWDMQPLFSDDPFATEDMPPHNCDDLKGALAAPPQAHSSNRLMVIRIIRPDQYIMNQPISMRVAVRTAGPAQRDTNWIARSACSCESRQCLWGLRTGSRAAASCRGIGVVVPPAVVSSWD